MKNVLIYNSSFFYIKTIKLYLEEKFSIKKISITNSFSETHELLLAKPFDLLILDINFESIDDFNFIKTIKKKYPKVKVLILSFINDDLFIKQCYKLKVSYFLNKSCSEVNFNHVLKTMLNDEIQNHKKDMLQNESPILNLNYRKNKLLKKLSKREEQIAQLLINGISNIEISKHLQLSMSTISTYKKRILLKTETSNLIELSNYFKKMNLTVFQA